MTTIHPETQIVASTFDAPNRICTYTYEHSDGSRYTVTVPLAELEKSGNTKDARRRFLAQKIINHVQSHPPDKTDEPAA